MIVRNIVFAIFLFFFVYHIRKLERMQAVRQTHGADNSTGNLIVSVALSSCFLVWSIIFNTKSTACCDMQFLLPLVSFMLNIFNLLCPCVRCLRVCQNISSLQETRLKFPLVSYISQCDPQIGTLDIQSGLACVASFTVEFSVSLVFWSPCSHFFALVLTFARSKSERRRKSHRNVCYTSLVYSRTQIFSVSRREFSPKTNLWVMTPLAKSGHFGFAAETRWLKCFLWHYFRC